MTKFMKSEFVVELMESQYSSIVTFHFKSKLEMLNWANKVYQGWSSTFKCYFKRVDYYYNDTTHLFENTITTLTAEDL